MADIQSSLQTLANTFVQGVLKTLSTASLHELSALTSATDNRRGPRSASALDSGRKSGRGPAPQKAAKGRSTGGRRVRRSSGDVTVLAERVAEFVRDAGGDVAVSDIAKALDVDTADITRPVAIALQAGKITKRGEKRLTRYFSGDGQGRSRARKR